MSIADELRKLHDLHVAGAITDDEYSRAKAKVLAEPAASAAEPLPRPGRAGAASVEQQTRQWAMFLHFSQFAGFVVPLAGFILPIVLWQVKKDELPEIDRHGKIVMNWIISEIIYAFICVLLVFFVIGIPLLIALGIVGIVFPLVGGMKANNGVAWEYPLAIAFLPTVPAWAEAVRNATPDQSREVLERKCLQCGVLIPAKAEKCPACGWSHVQSVTAELRP